MKTFKEYCETEGTYMCLLPDPKTQRYLKAYVEKLGLEPVDRFHLTVVYSHNNLCFLKNGVTMLPEPIELEVDSFSMLGDPDSDYRALAANFNSPNVQQIFDELVQKGYKHHYDDFKQHIALAYKPDEEKCADLLNGNMNLPKFKIVLNKMEVKPI